jgi:hypothetical protein
MPTILTVPEVIRALPRRDWAVCAAMMFVWTTDHPLRLAVCLAGERDFVRTAKRSGAYEAYQFFDEDYRAIFRMICDTVREDLHALAPDGPIHV